MGRIKLIHYHTNTKDAVPAAENLALGEIAVNTNSGNPFIAIKDSAGNILQNSFNVQLVNTRADDSDLSKIDPTVTGYTNTLRVFKTSAAMHESFSAGDESSNIMFGCGDTKGIISITYGRIPTIKFSGFSTMNFNNPTFIGIAGSGNTVYDLSKIGTTTNNLTFNGKTFNGSSAVSIDSIDCGEF